MAKLLSKPKALKASNAELAGNAHTKLRLKGSLGVGDSAAYLGVHKVTLKEFIDKGLVQSIKVGARHYLDEGELVRVKRLLNDHGSLANAYRYSQRNKDPKQIPGT